MFGNIFSAKGQPKDKSSVHTDRKPCVAGQFYPGNSTDLREELQAYFAKAKPRTTDELLAIISPHAGYVFSGQVAAHSFNQIDPDKKYENIFVIGSSHRIYFDGASIYNIGNYETPLGKVKVDREFATQLIEDHEVFEYRKDAHLTEHSLEVQIPFLQYHLNTDFKIVPIIIATQTKKTISKIAEALKPYFNSKNLFVISSDFSHYPDYESANKVDHLTATAITSNSPEIFMQTLSANEEMAFPGLSTSMCGWSSMLALLNITSEKPGIEITPIDYKNSGDVAYGDKNRVVGYWAIAVTQKNNIEEDSFYLSEKDKKKLLHIARTTIEEFVIEKSTPEIDTQNFSKILFEHAGAFVTLHIDGELRGCIGRFNPDAPLYKVVQDMAISAATNDYRFNAVAPEELSKINIEISVLTPMQKIVSIDEIKLGRHGIYIKQGYNTGTFLPQVATNTGWNLEEFLGHCARDKARIGWDGWQNADIYTYEAIIFDEKDFE